MSEAGLKVGLNELPKEECIRKLAARYGAKPRYLEAMLRLFRYMTELEKAVETHFGQWDITRGRFMIMMMLLRQDNRSLTPSELAEKLDVTRGNMTGLIDGLERQGYITKTQDSDDRRTVTIKLSDSG